MSLEVFFLFNLSAASARYVAKSPSQENKPTRLSLSLIWIRLKIQLLASFGPNPALKDSFYTWEFFFPTSSTLHLSKRSIFIHLTIHSHMESSNNFNSTHSLLIYLLVAILCSKNFKLTEYQFRYNSHDNLLAGNPYRFVLRNPNMPDGQRRGNW